MMFIQDMKAAISGPGTRPAKAGLWTVNEGKQPHQAPASRAALAALARHAPEPSEPLSVVMALGISIIGAT